MLQMASGKLLGPGGNKSIVKDRGTGFRRQHLDRKLSNRREPQPAGARSLDLLVASAGTWLHRVGPLGSRCKARAVLRLVEIGAEDEENDRQKSVSSESPIMERQSQREGDWRRDLVILERGNCGARLRISIDAVNNDARPHAPKMASR